MVQQASDLCEHENHLTRVIADLNLPLTDIDDLYKRTPSHGYDLTPMLRLFLYKYAGDYSDSELADRVDSWQYLRIRFDLNGTPTQQTLSYTWRNRFDADLRKLIVAAGKAIRREAIEHGVIRDDHADGEDETDSEFETDEVPDDLSEAKIRETMRAAREHIFPAFDTGRAANARYSDECILSMQSYLSLANCGTAQGTKRFARMSRREQTPHGDTHLRAIKKLGKPTGRQSTLTEYHGTGRKQRTEPWKRVCEELQGDFSTAVENTIKAIRDTKPFREPVVAAIDITDTMFYPSPWEDYEDGIAKDDFPAPVNGLKENGERGYQFATLTIVGENAPLILAVEPIRDASYWEDDDIETRSRAEVVDALLEEASKHVDMHLVMADREFDGHDVLHTLDSHDVTYLIPKRAYEADLEGIEKVEDHPVADVGVEPDVELGANGEVSHEVNFMYVPSTEEDGDYAVFLTNRDDVAPEDVRGLCNRYSRRWEIENEYKQIKKFLPTMASTDYRVRCFNFMFACLLYNVWRLADYLLKLEVGKPIRDEPVLTAGEAIELLACFLVPYG
ncbi:transposase [Halobaculum sp. D14]|uniref:transposase n=1 Tax=Halobacteriales TaxID=2235 RepID=UPI003EBC006D